MMMPEVLAQADASEVLEPQRAVEEPVASTEAANGAGESSTCKRVSTASTTMTSDENPAVTCGEDSASTDSNPNAVASAVDLEAGPAEAVKAEAREVQQHPSQWRALLRQKRCVGLCALSLLLTGLSVFLCFLLPLRDPSWHLTALDIDVGKFSQVMMGQGNVTEPISFNADVEFFNPNIIGTTTEPGAFEVFYGSEVMCYGTTKSVTVGGKSTANMRVDITTKFTKAMADAIMVDVTTHNFELKVHAKVLVIAKVGLLRVKTRVLCDVTAATMRLFEDPASVLKDAACTYSYSL